MVKKFSLVLILLLIVFPAAFAAAQVDLVGGIGGSAISMGFGTQGGNTGGDFQMVFDVSAETDVMFNANHGLYTGLGVSATAARNGSASLDVQNARQGFRSGCRSRASCQRDRLRRRTFRSILERESGLLHDRAGVPAWRCRGEDGFPPVRRKDEQRYVLGDAYRSVLLSRLLLLRSLRPVCPMAMQAFVSADDISE